MNQYISQIPTYFDQQDQMGMMPMYQNIGQQQANQQAALAQQNQQVMQAGQTGQQGGGMNALAMAMMLRKKGSKKPTYNGPDYGTNPDFDNSHFDTNSYD
jgi:hypothetical protein